MRIDLPSIGPFGTDGDTAGCHCAATFHEPAGTAIDDRVVLELDASDCPGTGDLATSPACRATVVDALTDRDADAIRTIRLGREHTYTDRAVALLVAAGRFRDQIGFHEDRLADRVRHDPLGAAREATGRSGPASRIVAETGLAELASTAADDADAFRTHSGPTVATMRIASSPPPESTLVDRWDLPTGAAVRLYDGAAPLRTYHLTPPTTRLDDTAFETLAAARDRLLSNPQGGERAAGRAVRAVASESDPVGMLATTLRRHTRGHGVLEHVFADGRVSDATLSAPVTANPLRVVVDGERCRTNIRLPPEGAATLASRLRRTSGRGFSRATPTLDATLETPAGTVRVAATTAPASEGLSFAFRRGDVDAWTLARLVDVDTLTPAAAGLLSVAVDRGVTGLVAGGRGAGKTTLLGALLWELDATTRTILIEDTPELPAQALTMADRDVLRLRVGDGAAPSPNEAVHTALRLGGGALVVGEVRGSEAAALYEAMRVGAAGETVLGTIHGEDTAAVHERVVSDLDVSESSFGATDLVVLCANHAVDTIAEVHTHGDGVAFEPLFKRTADGLRSTGLIDRGESRLIDGLGGPDESYAVVSEAITNRTASIREAVAARHLQPGRYVAGNSS